MPVSMAVPPHFIVNPAVRRGELTHPLFSDGDYDDVAAFFDSRTDLAPTPLQRLDGLARALGVRSVVVKDESARFGLNAFKIAGVTYAVHRLLRRRGGDGTGLTFVCASTGNHGRAVARAARLVGARARIYVPAGTVVTRLDAIAGEDAEPIVVDGSYEEAVAHAAADAARAGWTLIPDTACPGAGAVPGWIMAGYTRLLTEAARSWTTSPSVVLVQAGVGGLAAAVASWCAAHLAERRPAVLTCEPDTAACVLESIRAGRPVTLTGALTTVQAGLRCAEPSAAAWPALRGSIDGCLAISDAQVFDAMRRFGHPEPGDPAIVAGPSGACGLAALTATLESPEVARTIGLGRGADVLLFNTEGNTDPSLFARVTEGARLAR
jgi:diaminopropionate ammonia-lyase